MLVGTSLYWEINVDTQKSLSSNSQARATVAIAVEIRDVSQLFCRGDRDGLTRSTTACPGGAPSMRTNWSPRRAVTIARQPDLNLEAPANVTGRW